MCGSALFLGGAFANLSDKPTLLNRILPQKHSPVKANKKGPGDNEAPRPDNFSPHESLDDFPIERLTCPEWQSRFWTDRISERDLPWLIDELDRL